MVLMDDELLGLTKHRQPVGAFAMMCRACITVQNVRHAFKRCAHFWNLFQHNFEHRVLISGGRVFYQLYSHTTPLNNYATESTLTALHRLHCWLIGQYIPILSVALPFPKPAYHEEYAEMFYQASIQYDQPYAQIEFDTRQTNLNIVQTAHQLEADLIDSKLTQLALPRRYRALADQTRQWLEKNIKIAGNQATLNECARQLQMNPQTLHRRLQKENTSFKQLKMQVKRDTAINLLFGNNHKIEQIARIVGFSEPSAFVRAFKSWTGETPLAYQRNNR